MRKIVVPAFVTLDGIIQSPGSADEDTSHGFTGGGWFWPYADEATDAMDELFDQPFELLLGRRTYDVFASFWPRVEADSPLRATADRFNAATKHVATHRPDSLDWSGSRALGPDAVGAVRALRQGNGSTLLAQGSSELVQQLLAAELVDELILIVVPILLGSGKRLFDGRTRPTRFHMASSRSSSKGNVVSHYVRAGGMQTASTAT